MLDRVARIKYLQGRLKSERTMLEAYRQTGNRVGEQRKKKAIAELEKQIADLV